MTGFNVDYFIFNFPPSILCIYLLIFWSCRIFLFCRQTQYILEQTNIEQEKLLESRTEDAKSAVRVCIAQYINKNHSYTRQYSLYISFFYPSTEKIFPKFLNKLYLYNNRKNTTRFFNLQDMFRIVHNPSSVSDTD